MVFKKGYDTWNKGMDSRTKRNCKICDFEYLKLISSKSKYCSKVCYWKSMVGHSRNKGVKRTIEYKENKRRIMLERKKRLGYINSAKTREKQRIVAINNIKNKTGLAVNIGKHEKQILDEIEEFIGFKIERQYPILGYFVDGYFKRGNVVFEVDEKFHKNRLDKDKIRQWNIMKKLNCTFMRIPCEE